MIIKLSTGGSTLGEEIAMRNIRWWNLPLVPLLAPIMALAAMRIWLFGESRKLGLRWHLGLAWKTTKEILLEP